MGSSIEYLHQLRDEQKKLQERFNALKTLNTGEKLSIYDDILYIDNENNPLLHFFQPILRFIFYQSRYRTHLFLQKYFKEYELNCKNIYAINSVFHDDIELIKTLKSNHKDYIKQIMPGLEKIKDIYPDEIDMHKLITNFDINIKNITGEPLMIAYLP